MKKIFTLIGFSVSCLFAGTVLAQQAYQKTADIGGDDYANMSVGGSDGSHYLVGSTSAAGGGGYDAFITKLDSSGNVLWTKQYGGSGTEYGTSLMGTNDNNLLLVGRSDSYSSSMDIFVVKTDLDGNVIWAKTYGTGSEDYGLSSAEVEDTSGYLIVGETRGSVNNQGAEIPLIRIDAGGNVIWAKSAGTPTGNERGYNVANIGEQGWVVGGYSNAAGIGVNDALFFVVDTSGNLAAAFAFGGNSDDDIRRVLPGTDADAYMVGNTRSFGGVEEVFIAKFDVSGFPVLTWFKTYGGAGSESVTSAKLTPDGQIIFTALTTSFGQGENSLVASVDTSGALLIAKNVGSSGSDILMDIEISNNPLLVGYSNSFNGGANNDVYYIRPTQTADMRCHSHDTTITVATQSPTMVGPTITDFAVNDLTETDSLHVNVIHAGTGTVNVICEDSTTPPLAIEAIGRFAALEVFPNPASNRLNISFHSYATSDAAYTVTNLYGAEVYSIRKEAPEGKIAESIDIASLPAGSYTLTLQSGNTRASKRFIVVN